MAVLSAGFKLWAGAVAGILVAVAATAGLVAAMALDLQRSFPPPRQPKGIVLVESCPECDLSAPAATAVAPAKPVAKPGSVARQQDAKPAQKPVLHL